MQVFSLQVNGTSHQWLLQSIDNVLNTVLLIDLWKLTPFKFLFRFSPQGDIQKHCSLVWGKIWRNLQLPNLNFSLPFLKCTKVVSGIIPHRWTGRRTSSVLDTRRWAFLDGPVAVFLLSNYIIQARNHVVSPFAHLLRIWGWGRGRGSLHRQCCSSLFLCLSLSWTSLSSAKRLHRIRIYRSILRQSLWFGLLAAEVRIPWIVRLSMFARTSASTWSSRIQLLLMPSRSSTVRWSRLIRNVHPFPTCGFSWGQRSVAQLHKGCLTASCTTISTVHSTPVWAATTPANPAWLRWSVRWVVERIRQTRHLIWITLFCVIRRHSLRQRYRFRRFRVSTIGFVTPSILLTQLIHRARHARNHR